MQKIWKITRGLTTLVYLLAIFYLLLNNTPISTLYKLPLWFIPTLTVISILYLSWRYLELYLKTNELEHEFTTIVNHTFRTPITNVVWLIKELEKDLPKSEQLLYLQNINNSIEKILGIVDIFAGIKTLNDSSSYFFEATSIREIVEKSIVKYRGEINKKNLAFQVSTFRDIPLLTLDLKKITFVVDTLLENAVWYTKNDGKVLIECIAKRHKLTLYVSDTGIGLNFIDKMRIFSRFYRSKQAILLNTDGMGLRLYLAKQIIKRHKGRIYAKSLGRNKGTTFFLELPFSHS